MKKNIVFFVIGALVIAGGSFYGGMAYAQNGRMAQANLFQGGGNASQQGGTRRFGGTGTGGSGIGGRGGNSVNGQIIAKDDKSITIQLSNGGSQFAFFSPSTSIMKLSAGTSDDLQKGVDVSANGTTNSDGSVTAQMIQIRPAGFAFPGASGSSQQAVLGGNPPTGA